MTIDTGSLTDWIQSKTTISTIASLVVYIAGVQGWMGLDYALAVQISTALAALAVIFMRNAVAKVEIGVAKVETDVAAVPAATVVAEDKADAKAEEKAKK